MDALTLTAPYELVCTSHAKLAASSVLPLPLYFATCGYWHSGRVRVVFWSRRTAGSVSGALPSSTQARPMWLLNDLYVSALYRRNGVGRRLMETAKQHAIGAGACVIELVTAANNRTAQVLYEKVGYKRDEEFVRYELWL